MKSMQMKYGRKFSSCILCMALMALSVTGCGGKSGKGAVSLTNPQGTESSAQTPDGTQTSGSTQTLDGTQTSVDEDVLDGGQSELKSLGEGGTEFLFTVVDKDGSETRFIIHTDKEIVGEALTELGLIEGEESKYGLYVEAVNGITADYDKDGVYWAFYINDEYAVSGVDSTVITEGDVYAFKVE